MDKPIITHCNCREKYVYIINVEMNGSDKTKELVNRLHITLENT